MNWSIPLSAAGFTSFVVGVTLGTIVFRSRPHEPRNRWLAALLFTLGTGMAVAWGVYHGAPTDRIALAAGRASLLVLFMTAPIYLLFLGTLSNVANGWLRQAAVRRVLVGLTIGAVLLWPWMRHGAIVAPILERHGVRYAEFGPAAPLVFAPTAIAALIGLVYAVQLWRRTQPGTLARRGATAYLAAFAIWDAAQLTFSVLASFLSGQLAWLELMTPVAALLFMSLLSYGVLAHQVLDLDLRLKFGISRGTVAAIIAGAALVGGEVLERTVGADGLWAAVACGAATAIAFRPLARLGDQIAARALPGVEDTDTYRGRRAEEIYRSAVQDARRDGRVTDAERAVLDGLARSLGLASSAVRRLES